MVLFVSILELSYYGLGSYDLVSHGYIDLGPERQEDIGPGAELDESYLLSCLEWLVIFGVAYHPAGKESGNLAAEHLCPVLILEDYCGPLVLG